MPERGTVSLNVIVALVVGLLSLAGTILGAGLYFGKQEQRITTLEQRLEKVEQQQEYFHGKD